MPAQIKLHAGPLSLVFEAGDLRYIALDEYEILRRVYVAVRDQRWGTAPAILSNLQVTKSNSSFDITFDIENKQVDLDFSGAARLAVTHREQLILGWMAKLGQLSCGAGLVFVCCIRPGAVASTAKFHM